jgi:hypothetical protein
VSLLNPGGGAVLLGDGLVKSLPQVVVGLGKQKDFLISTVNLFSEIGILVPPGLALIVDR